MANTQRYIKNIESRFDKFIKFNNVTMLNLSSNDYLNISTNKELTDEFLSTIGKNYFLSSASARLLSGTETIYLELEKSL